MLEFCSLCESLIKDNSCTNKRCKNFKNIKPGLLTYQQEEYIKSLSQKAGREIKTNNLTKDAADLIIKEFLKEVDKDA